MTTEEKINILKKLQNWDSIFVPFSQATRMPFLICDPESYNDQARVYTDKQDAQAFGEKYSKEKYPMAIAEVPNKQFLIFYMNLLGMGVNSVVVTDKEIGEVELEITDIVRKPDYSKVPEEKRPLMNPEMQLSGVYFMQEMRRPLKPEERTVDVNALEEEMAANLVKAKFLIPVERLEDAEEGKDIQIPYVKDKEGNILQPIFTDMTEFRKFAGENKKLSAVITVFRDLEQFKIHDGVGFVVNPNGFNLPLQYDQLEGLRKRFE